MNDLPEIGQYFPEQWQEIHSLLQRVRTGFDGQVADTTQSQHDLLRSRARLYARHEDKRLAAAAEREDLVLFTLGSDTYGIDCGDIEEVIPLSSLVALPHTNRGILGISSLRGILFAVIDLKRILNIPASELTTMHRVLMLRHEQFRAGFLVDSVQGMRSYDRSDLQELPSEVHERSRAYLHGLLKGNVMLLNTRIVLQDPLVSGEDRNGK